jgi:hypothetical protein
MADRAWLDGLKPGDEVGYEAAGWSQNTERAIVARRTARRIVVSVEGRESWVHAESGQGPRGGYGYGTPAALRPWAPALAEAWERRRLIGRVSRAAWADVSTATLRAICDLLKAKE